VADPGGRFRRDCNRANFTFKHGLAGNTLFELSALAALARRGGALGPHYWASGAVPAGGGWSDGTVGRQTLPDTITNIEHNDSIVILRSVEQDPMFAPLLQNLLVDIVELTGERMRADVAAGEVAVVLNSPERITPYHMDADPAFHLLIAGEHSIHVFDHADRTLVSARELEDFYAVGRRRAECRPGRLNDSNDHELLAGDGVHVPGGAPHWAKNHGRVSIALRVSYVLRSVERLRTLHRFNRRLRRLGLTPAPPGVAPWRDRLKLAAANSFNALRASHGGAAGGRQGPVWRPPK
jgi:hypothetical protein